MFDECSEAFVKWFTAQPGAKFHPDLALVDLRERNAGRGIIATRSIPAETELFTLGRSSVISVANSTLSTILPQLFTAATGSKHDDDDDAMEDDNEEITLPDPSSPWVDLILVLIYEYLQGPASVWKAYLDVLPTEFDTMMFWTPKEVSELQASAVKDKIGKESADEMIFTKVIPVINANISFFYPAGSSPLSDADLTNLAHRMGSLVMAYAFDLQSDDADESGDQEDGWEEDHDGPVMMGMVPMADMLNADAEFNAHLNHGETQLTMVSLRTIAAGEEILNYYGALPQSDLARRYGYVSQKHSRYDVDEIPWTLVQKVIQEQYPGKSIDSSKQEDLMEESFVLERESGEPSDEGLQTSPATFKGFPEDLQTTILETLETLHPGQTKKQYEAEFYNIMITVLNLRLSAYTSNLQQDEELLKSPEVRGRLRMAIEIRRGEKQLLDECIAYASYKKKTLEAISAVKATSKETAERPSKRQKR